MQIINDKETYDIGNTSGGIQSTAMFWAAILGILPRPDAFIFADTGWERSSSYQTIQELIKVADGEGIPFHVVNNGNVRTQAIESGNAKSTYGDWRDEDGYGFLKMPVYTIDQLGNRPRMSHKQCTTDFKIRPIRKFLREQYGMQSRFNQWIGISLDEAQRMRTSDVKYVTLCYPLVRDLKWTRGHCIEFLKKHDIPIPTKSACIGCPLHSDENWHDLTDEEKQDVIDFDESIRNLQSHIDALPKPKKIPEDQLTLIDMDEVDEYVIQNPLARKQDVQLFAHASALPLKTVLAREADYKQEDLIDVEDAVGCGGDCFI